VPATILMPKLGLTMEVGTVVKWLKQEGEPVRAGQVICEVETDKITADVESPQDGTLLKILVPEDTEVKVQAVLALVGQPGEDLVMSGSAAAAPGLPSPDGESVSPPAAASRPAERGGPRITPRARKLMEENGLSLEAAVALGKERITEADVQDMLRTMQGRLPIVAAPRPMSRTERLVAARMAESFRDIPQFSIRSVIDLEHLFSLFPSGARGINALVLRAVALAISRSPEVQHRYHENTIIMPTEINVGFAVASGRELVVPVIHGADRKKIRDIESEAAALVEKARAHELKPLEVTGGTFTVSNLGMFGIDSFTPIVNPGESAILGIGAVRTAARVRDGAVVAAPVMELTLVCDHRSVNGAAAAAFFRELKRIIETEEVGSW
jgi:pyruvate dehydrogenase E2 component (dihydrolipoamide acetyltransferase)